MLGRWGKMEGQQKQEKEQIEIIARNKAGEYFKEGHNCSESIFLAYRDMLFPKLDKDLVMLATGFGGGLGESGCTCGALTGSVMVLGLLQGRTFPDDDRYRAYNLAHEFHNKFKGNFKTTCCRVLNGTDYQTPEHLKRCLKITGTTSKMLMEFLQEKHLITQDLVNVDK